MGPRWSEEELEIFLKCTCLTSFPNPPDFRLSGLRDVEAMQTQLNEAGYKRNVNNLLAVYLKVHKCTTIVMPLEQEFPYPQHRMHCKRPFSHHGRPLRRYGDRVPNGQREACT
jgi:hypothetical protein